MYCPKCGGELYENFCPKCKSFVDEESLSNNKELYNQLKSNRKWQLMTCLFANFLGIISLSLAISPIPSLISFLSPNNEDGVSGDVIFLYTFTIGPIIFIASHLIAAISNKIKKNIFAILTNITNILIGLSLIILVIIAILVTNI